MPRHAPAKAVIPATPQLEADPLREVVSRATGPNPEGHDHQAVATHTLPDPAVVDDATAPLDQEG